MLPSPDPSMTGSTSANSPNLPEGRDIDSPPHPRKPIPRKGHTKSRRGCYNCKRRRIKCSETHPECYNCEKAGLVCEYPVGIDQATQRSPSSPSPRTLSSLQSTPGVFSMADLRLFHHFLTNVHPHLPIGAEKIWAIIIPSFAHNYEHLIHSILALSASHLNAASNSCVAEPAIQHRILAVKLLNEALSTPPQTQSDRDTRMAATLALALQSTYFEDGMAEFLVMIRGHNLIASDKAFEESASSFNLFTHPPLPSQFQPLPPSTLTTATFSLNSLSHLPMSPNEHTYHTTLLQTLTHISNSSPTLAHQSLKSLYTLPSTWSPETFTAFIAPGNTIARILLAHFFAVQGLLLGLVSGGKRREGVGSGLGLGQEAVGRMVGWVEGLCQGLGEEMGGFVEWPKGVAGRVEEEVRGW
ncbi:hypothetical protein T440DRAFT_519502 [Plenodomus tracheiphilus IPT5]|uniref:Zn(2)-C6 fungal-type domain-containing protein n=1 Tax=Plenodomus tracheiphilus IPT5 TaxID=1408161 RepID=A0A6A7B3I9_9PLEO|nr:hypothetical protein T440DRAFT_519502 [Plenodomus tracheiphilus IPT5]